MSKNKKTSAAIVGLLDAIKSEGIETVDDLHIIPSKLRQERKIYPDLNLFDRDMPNEPSIAYEIRMIDPHECRPWHLANRLREYLTTESCTDLIQSIKKVGQQIPALIRKNAEGNGYDLICGARRLFACEHLGIKLKAAIVSLSDKEALLAMDAENRPREDISPYERACDYKRWVEMGIYKNYSEIIEDIGVKKSWFSQLMALAELNEDIIKAFRHPANLKQKWGYELQLICKKDNALENAMLETARSIIGQALPPASVFQKLKNVRADSTQNANKNLTWIINTKGKKIFKIKYSKSGRAQFGFKKKLSEILIDKIINSTKNILEETE